MSQSEVGKVFLFCVWVICLSARSEQARFRFYFSTSCVVLEDAKNFIFFVICVSHS